MVPWIHLLIERLKKIFDQVDCWLSVFSPEKIYAKFVSSAVCISFCNKTDECPNEIYVYYDFAINQ